MLPARATPGRLAENVMHFARVLRSAGMPVGTDRVMLAQQALQVTGLETRADFHAVLGACLLDRVEHRALFDQAFALFWRAPDLMGRIQALPPEAQAKEGKAPPPPENRRLGEALFAKPPNAPDRAPPKDELQFDAQLSWNDREVLRRTDFDTMTADEWRSAKRLLQRMWLQMPPLPTRRQRCAPHPGRVDWRATLRAAARLGGEFTALRWRAPRMQPPPLIVLADISGSMSRYSRMLLHFAHGLGQAGRQRGGRVDSFVFGTRLTRTTRLLASRDPDLAVGEVVRAVQDWSGGTRITACLHAFNQRWARRVLDHRATVLLITDGLEHGEPALLAFEIERLHKSCRRLVWLNPLLRFEQFEPRAGGIRAMLPHVDRFLPAHNLQSLEDLVKVLAQPLTAPQRRPGLPIAMERPPCS